MQMQVVTQTQIVFDCVSKQYKNATLKDPTAQA